MKKLVLLSLCLMISGEMIAQSLTSPRFELADDQHGALRPAADLQYTIFNPSHTGIQKINTTLQALDSILIPGQIKDLFIYDGHGRITFYHQMEWNAGSSLWQNSWKEEYVYGINGALATETYYNWEETPLAWVPQRKYEYTYNSSKQLIEKVSYDWHTNQWKPDTKHQFNYGSTGLLESQFIFEYSSSSSSWENSQKYEFSYTLTDKLDVLISSSWNASGNQWIFSYKEENEYNQSDLLSESVISYYSSSPPYAWLPQMKWLYTYNASNFLIERLQKQWSQQTNDWELNYKNDLVYDAFQNLIEQISSQWNSATSTWEYDDKVAGIYNNNYSFSDLLLPFWFEEMFDFFNHMLLSYEEYDFNGSSWVLYDTRDLYYSAVNVIGLKEENLSAFVLYPNPAESYIRIMLPEQMTHATLEIHDLSGRLISRHNITHDAMIPVYHLPKGLYIYRINRSTSYGKLIVN